MSLYDEGHTIAGWTGVAITTVGGSVAGLGVCTSSLPLVGAGLAVVVVSALVTWALHLSGWGKPPGVRPRDQWGMRVRDTQAREGHEACVGCRLAGRGRKRSDEAPAASAPVPVSASVSASASGAIPAESIPLSPVE